ncbi:hypothetical protein ATCC90586_008834 [Pythium insidiosum]|nr:hypothetical protein ATCC90586_008834 [Pythium insidiosum]
MQVSLVLRVLALALCAVSVVAVDASSARRLAGGNAACGGARVRKPWSKLTPQEQATYVEALDLAIQDGVVNDFAAIHLESLGEKQAHSSCAFFTWHRRMLLAFESYLRDRGDKFACLTLPYYDVHTAYVAQSTMRCGSMFECSPIFAAIGGPSTQQRVAALFNGQEAFGFLHSGAPFAKNCDDKNQVCGGIVRADLSQVQVPSGAGFGSFVAAVVNSKDYATFLQEIQHGLHNDVHNALSGAMATFASPRDVFFYSWHAAIDMFLSVFHLCHIGAPMTPAQLQSSLLAFADATQTCGGADGVGSGSSIIMNVVLNGKLVDVAKHPKLGRYFAHVGDKMWNYGDTRQLGDYSYSA